MVARATASLDFGHGTPDEPGAVINGAGSNAPESQRYPGGSDTSPAR